MTLSSVLSVAVAAGVLCIAVGYPRSGLHKPTYSVVNRRSYGLSTKQYGPSALAYGPSATFYGVPAYTYGQPARTYGAPAKIYRAPAKTYEVPAKTYGEPAKTYGVPVKTYEAPAKTYGVPVQTYGPPTETYGAPKKCGKGLVRKVDGTCAKPIINKNIFLYNAPVMKQRYAPKPHIPDPKIDYNFVFIKAPSTVIGPDPIIIPPPKQKTLIYVLSQQPAPLQQSVIELPADLSEPEVYFINYNEGENPSLPGGIDLQTALSQSAQVGNLIEGDGGSGIAGAAGFDYGGGFGYGGNFDFDAGNSFTGSVGLGGNIGVSGDGYSEDESSAGVHSYGGTQILRATDLSNSLFVNEGLESSYT